MKKFSKSYDKDNLTVTETDQRRRSPTLHQYGDQAGSLTSLDGDGKRNLIPPSSETAANTPRPAYLVAYNSMVPLGAILGDSSSNELVKIRTDLLLIPAKQYGNLARHHESSPYSYRQALLLLSRCNAL